MLSCLNSILCEIKLNGMVFFSIFIIVNQYDKNFNHKNEIHEKFSPK